VKELSRCFRAASGRI